MRLICLSHGWDPFLQITNHVYLPFLGPVTIWSMQPLCNTAPEATSTPNGVAPKSPTGESSQALPHGVALEMLGAIDTSHFRVPIISPSKTG